MSDDDMFLVLHGAEPPEGWSKSVEKSNTIPTLTVECWALEEDEVVIAEVTKSGMNILSKRKYVDIEKIFEARSKNVKKKRRKTKKSKK